MNMFCSNSRDVRGECQAKIVRSVQYTVARSPCHLQMCFHSIGSNLTACPVPVVKQIPHKIESTVLLQNELDDYMSTIRGTNAIRLSVQRLWVGA
ncbi:hypothetical protein BgiMline_015557 [Biomphalaria glabrata]|nr:hypothetical protein BgiMline_008384 [Biomphalaria glabrata]KAI8773039.1 hypothetical protein BgiBS90_026518 [Biomphalaria glabrata]